MISAILGLLGSSAVGSLIGGIFAFLNRKVDIDLKKVELTHELLLRDRDIELAKTEMSGRLELASVEADGSIETARMNALGQSHGAERITADEIKAAGKLGWLMVVASVVNKLIRPVLTVVLMFSALYLNWVVIEQLTANWTALTSIQQYESGVAAFSWITAQASAAMAYWFVSRGVGK